MKFTFNHKENSFFEALGLTVEEMDKIQKEIVETMVKMQMGSMSLKSKSERMELVYDSIKNFDPVAITFLIDFISRQTSLLVEKLFTSDENGLKELKKEIIDSGVGDRFLKKNGVVKDKVDLENLDIDGETN